MDSSPAISIKEAFSCRACGGVLKPILDLGLQETISLGDKPLILAPLTLMKCDECHLVQLSHTVDRDSLFKHYYFRSNANETYRKHLREVYEDIAKRVNLKKGDVWVDIGSNDGSLLDLIPDGIIHAGFEPSNVYKTGTWQTSGATNDFFWAGAFQGNPFTVDKTARIVYAGFMFYDLDDPLSFLKDVKTVLAEDGLFVLEMNYLPSMLANNAIDNVVHEHLCYYTLRTLESLLFRAGLQAEDVSFNDINGGSFRVYIRHRSNHGPSATVSGVLAGERAYEKMEPYQEFARRVKDEMHRLSATIKLEAARGATVDLVGASTRGLVIVQQAGLDKRVVRTVVERNPEKVGKTYAGIPIISEEQSRQSPADLYVILPYSFSKEIMGRMPWGKRFIIPLPEVREIAP